MASAPHQERLDPVVSLRTPPAADGPTPPHFTFADGSAASVVVEAVTAAAAPATPSGFPALALLAALTAHILVGAVAYVLLLRDPPEEAKPPTDQFEIELMQDVAGRADGKAQRAPDGAPPPDARQEPDSRIPVQPADQPAVDTVTAPQRPTQPPSFDAMPAPPAPQPVPTTADAWAPRVQTTLTLPLPPPEPKMPGDVQSQPKADTAKPEPAPKPTATPAKPPAPAPTPPAPRPSVQAAAPPVPQRPSLQRSVDLRDVSGLAPSHDVAAGSSGNALEANYASLLFRAIDRVRFYPVGSRERQEEGRVVLRVTIGADGRLLDAFISSGSGYPELDAATMDMARRAAPYPPLPRALGAERASFNVPVIFGIRRF